MSSAYCIQAFHFQLSSYQENNGKLSLWQLTALLKSSQASLPDQMQPAFANESSRVLLHSYLNLPATQALREFA